MECSYENNYHTQSNDRRLVDPFAAEFLASAQHFRGPVAVIGLDDETVVRHLLRHRITVMATHFSGKHVDDLRLSESADTFNYLNLMADNTADLRFAAGYLGGIIFQASSLSLASKDEVRSLLKNMYAWLHPEGVLCLTIGVMDRFCENQVSSFSGYLPSFLILRRLWTRKSLFAWCLFDEKRSSCRSFSWPQTQVRPPRPPTLDGGLLRCTYVVAVFNSSASLVFWTISNKSDSHLWNFLGGDGNAARLEAIFMVGMLHSTFLLFLASGLECSISA